MAKAMQYSSKSAHSMLDPHALLDNRLKNAEFDALRSLVGDRLNLEGFEDSEMSEPTEDSLRSLLETVLNIVEPGENASSASASSSLRSLVDKRFSPSRLSTAADRLERLEDSSHAEDKPTLLGKSHVL